MLYYLAPYLMPYFGPFRLLRSHTLLLAGGTFCAALITVFLLPRFWSHLPHDHGKAILGADGMRSKGKPTGAGFLVSLFILPIILLFAPLSLWDAAAMLAIYAAMIFGYLDDRSSVPWGELKKGLLDAIVSLAIAVFLFIGHAETIGGVSGARMIMWMPFFKDLVLVPFYVYVPSAAFLLWFVMNATNCSDGVDGLAGSLTTITLVMLAVFLYIVVGYRPVAHYFLLPVYAEAARWAIVVMIVAGAFVGYLWHNAEPSRVLMGDAGSRFLGILIATASLMSGNPFLIFALAPVVLTNGGGGLAKLVLLRVAKSVHCDIGENNVIRKVRFPLHDHCKKNLGWSNAQVLMRFILLQMIIMPVLIVLLLKIR